MTTNPDVKEVDNNALAETLHALASRVQWHGDTAGQEQAENTAANLWGRSEHAPWNPCDCERPIVGRDDKTGQPIYQENYHCAAEAAGAFDDQEWKQKQNAKSSAQTTVKK